ncbi:putative glutaminase 2 isoform X9 [Drosophila innubila]|uniref:putative glutaminase 2 isoform X9 n=1 Tax=Drosophila innubila TaxID=198719 RepID=UPI00148C5BB3|nr:putative glutaminase 2 isoform X9 [Drosophila innubila]
MFKGVPTLANLNLRFLKGNSRIALLLPRGKATATSLDLEDANANPNNTPNTNKINVDVYSEEDLLKRAKFGHTGKQVQQKISSEKKLRTPPLLNLVFANRKLSFYDTSSGPKPCEENAKLNQRRNYSIRPHREQEQRNAEDVLFDMFASEETGLISMGKFLAGLKTTGIRRTDPRVRELMDNLKKVHKLNNYETGSSAETQHLNRETFKAVVSPNIVLIAKAFRQQFVIPDFSSFTKDIEEIYANCKANTSGKLADYIPQLARYSPNLWGVSVCTVDGQRFSIGDVDEPFTLQSCSKPLTYAIALEKLGPKVVHSFVGQEPSGRNFNELVLDQNSEEAAQSNDKCRRHIDVLADERTGEAGHDFGGDLRLHHVLVQASVRRRVHKLQ